MAFELRVQPLQNIAILNMSFNFVYRYSFVKLIID